MITHLRVENLVLVESATLSISSQFTAITGETGSGKTALIEALLLVQGNRMDTSCLRKDCSKGLVEAAFCIEHLPATWDILQHFGLSFDPKEELIIRRELVREGKARAFVNGQMVPLQVLQTLCPTLFELISQHSYQALTSTSFQRTTLDTYGNIQSDLFAYQEAWDKRETDLQKLATWQETQATAEKRKIELRTLLDEIQALHLKEGEEESLQEESKRWAHLQQIQEKLSSVLQALQAYPLHRLVRQITPLAELDKTLAEPSSQIHTASLLLDEATRSLEIYANTIDTDPKRLEWIEERLSAIEAWQRKCPQSPQILQQELLSLEQAEDVRITLEENALQTSQELERLGALLSQKRKNTAGLLSQELSSLLQDLNMPSAQITIEQEITTPTRQGYETPLFWMAANKGENSSKVEEHCSGGELSRLLFCIKLALSKKAQVPTLIFDEIDSNVGGETATRIGLKLREMGAHTQVLAITHFPQVAASAEHHFSVYKEEKEGRTYTRIRHLEPSEREHELVRMQGGELLSKDPS